MEPMPGTPMALNLVKPGAPPVHELAGVKVTAEG